VTGLLLVASEVLVAILMVVRRSASVVDRSWRARLLTLASLLGPPLVRPAAGAALAPDGVTALVSAVGLLIALGGKLSLGRSFGLVPANRGIVCEGLYRRVRHPIYLGYLITHAGFLVAHATPWNWSLLLLADAALVLRACCEERTLCGDPAYRRYAAHVKWRLVPGVF
jgi:protein-S-isoprenylcysteine O-methyltransferase Ste14